MKKVNIIPTKMWFSLQVCHFLHVCRSPNQPNYQTMSYSFNFGVSISGQRQLISNFQHREELKAIDILYSKGLIPFRPRVIRSVNGKQYIIWVQVEILLCMTEDRKPEIYFQLLAVHSQHYNMDVCKTNNKMATGPFHYAVTQQLPRKLLNFLYLGTQLR